MTEKPKRQMPKGGRKGGTVFPRVSLPDAVKYAKKLVSKTHVSSQPLDVVYSGIVGAKSGTGNIRISALKQFGFLKGDQKVGFSATDLAKKIDSAPPSELQPLYRKAALLPNVFKSIFNTFHGDIVTRAKLKQRAADLKVHPDETETCIDIYLKSLELANLITLEGDQIRHALDEKSIPQVATVPADDDENISDAEESEISQAENSEITTESQEKIETPVGGAPRAIFHVNVNLDSSLDTDKLAKQLELLKRYGAI